jgi:glycosyltransferase involved in cell wall biosynthesis
MAVPSNDRLSPGISIIIPCYNYGHFLPETLESLRQQTITNWECLVVDDGSTDGTAEIVKKMSGVDPRFRYLHQSNQGQPTARNTGLQNALGKYIQFLDADDLLAPDKLRIQSSLLDNDPWVDIVYGKVRYFETGKRNELFLDRWGDPMKEWMPMLSGRGTSLLRALTEKNILELGCVLFRKTAVDKMGEFDARLQGVEDYDYCFRAAAAGLRFRYLDAPETEILMRHHPDSFSKNRVAMYKKEIDLRRSIRATFRKMGDRELSALNEHRYAWRLRRLQDLIIDRTIKQKGKGPAVKELKWMIRRANLAQNLYFFPRIVKAMLSH